MGYVRKTLNNNKIRKNNTSSYLGSVKFQTHLSDHQVSLLKTIIQKPRMLPSCGSPIYNTWLPISLCPSASNSRRGKRQEKAHFLLDHLAPEIKYLTSADIPL